MGLVFVLLLVVAALVGVASLRDTAVGPVISQGPIKRHGNLRLYLVVALAALATVVYACFLFRDVEGLDTMIVPMLLVATWCLLPYGVLAILVARIDAMPRLRVGLVACVVGYAAVYLGWIEFRGGSVSYGWQLLFAPVGQLLMMAALCLGAAALARLAARGERDADR